MDEHFSLLPSPITQTQPTRSDPPPSESPRSFPFPLPPSSPLSPPSYLCSSFSCCHHGQSQRAEGAQAAAAAQRVAGAGTTRQGARADAQWSARRPCRQSGQTRAETKWTTRKERGAVAADRPKSIPFDPIRSIRSDRWMTASLFRLSLSLPPPSAALSVHPVGSFCAVHAS